MPRFYSWQLSEKAIERLLEEACWWYAPSLRLKLVWWLRAKGALLMMNCFPESHEWLEVTPNFSEIAERGNAILQKFKA